MEEIIIKILRERATEINTWVLIVLLIIAWSRKEYQTFITNKKTKAIQHSIHDKLNVISDRYSNTFSKDTTTIILKIVYANSFCQLISSIISLCENNKSIKEFRLSLSKKISIINDEQMQVLARFKYRGKTLDLYLDEEILNKETVMVELDNLNLNDIKEIERSFQTSLSLSLNKTIENL